MKKLFYSFLGLICLLFVGCEDDKFFTKFSSVSDLEGIWVRVDEDYNCAYSYEIRGDKLIYRQHSGYIDEENYFVCYQAEQWDDIIVLTIKYEFDRDEQAIYAAGIKAGVITRMGRNKAYYKDCSGILRDCNLLRVEGVKQGDYSISGARYTDPDQINLNNYDPYAESSCWAITTYSGSAEATEYTWTNEYWLAAGVKLALEVAQSAGADVAYSWHGVSASNEDACNAMNNN